MNLFRKSRTGWLLISLFVFNAAYAEEQGRETSVSWHQFKSEEGRFSIQFPTLPAIKTHDQNSIIGHVTNHLFESRSHLGDFSVDYSDLPGFAITFTGNETIYSHATGALLKDTLGKLKSSKDFNYQGHTGKHLIYDIPHASEKPEFDGQAYLLLIDKRLYVINVVAPANTEETQVNHFLNSLLFD